MNASNTLKKLGIEQTFNYIYKDPDKNMEKLMDWADKFSKGDFPSQRKAIREAIISQIEFMTIFSSPTSSTVQITGRSRIK